MSDRNPSPTNRQLLIILGIFTTIIVIMISFVSLLFDWAITQIPISWEQKLGALIIPVYEKKAKDYPQQQEILNSLLDRLESKLNNKLREKRDYRVIYIPEKTVNAFAIPGDVIGIFEGLVKEVKSENELMMILGHELGHFANRDHLRSLGKTLAIRIAIASIFGDNATLANSIGVLIKTISNATYSQSQEYQADEFGLMLLNKTYGHVTGATDFFKNFKDKKKLGWDFFSSHPAGEKRVKRLEKLIKQKQYKLGEYSNLELKL
ncbi:MAG: M48 family metallopeptidase [Trichodesmium sp. MAG_R04]|nr:M48 family metallopeptidase [Trichodesmium sp. MAG_R04]